MAVRRFDIAPLRKPVKTPQGFLRVDAYLTKVGIFDYRDDKGGVRRELRRDADVFASASLESFAMAPVTDDHPPDMLTPDNVRMHARGHLGETVHQDGDFVRASMLVTDADLIRKMEQGKNQLSCGYECDLDMTPGEWNGERYDAVQTNIRGNHVAVVDCGRAGPDVRVRMDSGDAAMVGAITFKERTPMRKIRIDGVEYEVSESAAQAFEKFETAHANMYRTLRADAEKSAARADGAEASLAKEKTARTDAENPEKFAARVSARVALEKTAAEHLDASVKLDKMSDLDIKCAVVAKLSGEVPKERRDSADYVDGRFEQALANIGKNALASGRVVIDASGNSDPTSKADAARNDSRTYLQDAWKNIPGAVVKKA